jgi:SAM-dependent methyltransferase
MCGRAAAAGRLMRPRQAAVDAFYAVEAALRRAGDRYGVEWLVYNPLTLVYYQRQAARNAPGVMRVLERLFPQAHSYVDVGAGTGAFAAEAQRRGRRVQACEYLRAARWMARRQGVDCRSLDLDADPPARLDGPFDLAYCFEVAEHVPAPLGDRLVVALADLAPLVVFTAAPPGQMESGGGGHVNEQPKEYWIERFARHAMDYDAELSDRVARAFDEEQVPAFWLSQNVMVFRRPRAAPAGSR